jgi:hypothetical protein
MTPCPNSTSPITDQLARVVQAASATRRVRAALFTTRDRDQALSVIKEAVVRTGRPLFHFTVASRRRYDPAQLRWEVAGGSGTDVAGLLRSAQELRGGGVVVFEDCAAHLRDDHGDSAARMQLADMLSTDTTHEGLVLVLLEPPEAEGHLPSMLGDQFVRLSVPYPRSEELAAIAREEIAAANHRTAAGLEVARIQGEAARLSVELVGLTRSAARDSLRDALAPNLLDFDSAAAVLRTHKAQLFERDLGMRVLSTEAIEEPIGLDYLVEHLAITRDKLRITGPGRARGVLLIGPAGTGKTMLARSIGRLVGLPVVEFRISSLMNSLLGETERRFAQAFATLEAMSPNVVFIDEIEKAFGDSSERDGGTMMRCTGALLSWLSDNPQPNFIVATSNSLKRMGEIGLTMTRSERFDAAFFVDVPTLRSRRAMLERWLAGHLDSPAETAQRVAEATEQFSGADIRSLVKQAADRAEYLRAPLSQELLLEQVARKRMRAIAMYGEFEELRRWGRMYCDPAGPAEE